MASVINKSHDAMISSMAKGLIPAGGDTTFITAVKAYLDANNSMFKSENGQYTVPHVRAAANYVLNKIK